MQQCTTHIGSATGSYYQVIRFAVFVGVCCIGVACGNASATVHPNGDTKEAGITTAVLDFFKTKPEPVLSCKELGEWWAKGAESFTLSVVRPSFRLELQYRPAACLACMEQKQATFVDAGYRQRVGTLTATELYVLKLYPGKTPPDSLSLELGDDLMSQLVEVVGNDTFPCAFMHVEAVPAMMPYRSAIIGFERPQDGQDRQVVLLDSQKKFGSDLVWYYPSGIFQEYMCIAPDSLTNPRS